MCSEPTSLAVLMAKEDKYATADSAMRVKVTASDKVVPTPATPKPAGDSRGGQNNNKRKADQMDSRSNSKLVASVEGETSAPQSGPPRKRSNRNNANWLPKQSFEQLLDAPCKIHSGVQPSNHTLQHCIFACRLSQGDGQPAPPRVQAAPHAPAPGPAPAPPPPPRDDGRLHDAGLCWFMSESLSLDGFEKSKSCVLRPETSTQSQTGSRLSGSQGGNLGIQGLEKKKSTRNQKIKI
ncbi:hypothetical protein D1007_14805 [Hordeum vulgare]|nr:hypothetical protein D1007_14805 [Hordeum vulgare]